MGIDATGFKISPSFSRLLGFRSHRRTQSAKEPEATTFVYGSEARLTIHFPSTEEEAVAVAVVVVVVVVVGFGVVASVP